MPSEPETSEDKILQPPSQANRQNLDVNRFKSESAVALVARGKDYNTTNSGIVKKSHAKGPKIKSTVYPTYWKDVLFVSRIKEEQ